MDIDEAEMKIIIDVKQEPNSRESFPDGNSSVAEASELSALSEAGEYDSTSVMDGTGDSGSTELLGHND